VFKSFIYGQYSPAMLICTSNILQRMRANLHLKHFALLGEI